MTALVEHRQVDHAARSREQVYGLTGGHIHHGELALDQLFTMRPTLGWADYRTPLAGLYLCGSGTHPGNGLTGASGQNAAREILKGSAIALADRKMPDMRTGIFVVIGVLLVLAPARPHARADAGCPAACRSR